MAVGDPVNLLKKLVKDHSESPWLEYKQNNSNPELVGSWISACANAAILAGKERAFMIFGVHDKSRALVGTSLTLSSLKKGAENFTNWISRVIEPRLMMEFIDFKYNGLFFSIICIEPTYDRPVRFSGTEYIRIGENVKKLSEFPDHERAIWLATGRRKFEDTVAAAHQSIEKVIEKLDADTYYMLMKEQKPKILREIIRRFELVRFIKDDLEGGYDITNLGALVIAKNLADFRSVSGKSIRIVRYTGIDKRISDEEEELSKGYAVVFSSLMKQIIAMVPKKKNFTSAASVRERLFTR